MVTLPRRTNSAAEEKRLKKDSTKAASLVCPHYTAAHIS